MINSFFLIAYIFACFICTMEYYDAVKDSKRANLFCVLAILFGVIAFFKLMSIIS